jgi:hypothetical protein
MDSKRTKWLLLAAAVWTSACGYIGEPLPPALNIPVAVHDLAVSEVGDKLIVSYTEPKLTTENLPVKELGKPDLRINGERVEVAANEKDLARYELPAEKWVGQTIKATVRSVSGRRTSGPSNEVELKVVQPLETPGALRADADAKGVRLTWTGEPGRTGVTWHVMRRTPEQPAAAQLGTADKPEYLDTTAVYGRDYEYTVRAAFEAAISETAGPVSIKPLDTFPPAVPTALSANTGVGRIGLTWERATEPDLRGYRVYRGPKGGELAVLVDLVETPAYSDRQIEPGKAYVYAVSSVDQAGNESTRSQPVEVIAP